jgi:hypothetical protein
LKRKASANRAIGDCLIAVTQLKIISPHKIFMRFLTVGLIDLLFVVAAVLVTLWIIGFVAFALGPLLYLLLVLAVVVIIIRIAFGRR